MTVGILREYVRTARRGTVGQRRLDTRNRCVLRGFTAMRAAAAWLLLASPIPPAVSSPPPAPATDLDPSTPPPADNQCVACVLVAQRLGARLEASRRAGAAPRSDRKGYRQGDAGVAELEALEDALDGVCARMELRRVRRECEALLEAHDDRLAAALLASGAEGACATLLGGACTAEAAAAVLGELAPLRSEAGEEWVGPRGLVRKLAASSYDDAVGERGAHVVVMLHRRPEEGEALTSPAFAAAAEQFYRVAEVANGSLPLTRFCQLDVRRNEWPSGVPRRTPEDSFAYVLYRASHKADPVVVPKPDEPSLAGQDRDTARRRFLELLYGFLPNEQVAVLQKLAIWSLPQSLTAIAQPPADELHARDVDPADRCGVCRLALQMVFRRLGSSRRTDDALTRAVDGACADIRRPDASTSEPESRRLRVLADRCEELLDSYADEIEDALVNTLARPFASEEPDVCSRLHRVCRGNVNRTQPHPLRKDKAPAHAAGKRNPTAAGEEKPGKDAPLSSAKEQPVLPPSSPSTKPAAQTHTASTRPPTTASTGGGVEKRGEKGAPSSKERRARVVQHRRLLQRQDCELCGLVMYQLSKERQRELENQRLLAAKTAGARSTQGAKRSRMEQQVKLDEQLEKRLDDLVEAEAAFTVCTQRATYASALRAPDPGASFDWDSCSRRTIERGAQLRTEYADALLKGVLDGSEGGVCIDLLDGCSEAIVRTHITEVDQMLSIIQSRSKDEL